MKLILTLDEANRILAAPFATLEAVAEAQATILDLAPRQGTRDFIAKLPSGFEDKTMPFAREQAIKSLGIQFAEQRLGGDPNALPYVQGSGRIRIRHTR